MYYRGSGIVIVGFDVTNYESYESCKRWIDSMRDFSPTIPVIVAVGNKIDLADSRRVKTEEASKFFSEFYPPVPYFETSAKTGAGVNELFDSAVQLWLDSPASLTLNNNPQDAILNGNTQVVVSDDKRKKKAHDKCVIC